MAVAIRKADLERDRDALIRTHQRYLNPQADSRRYDWLYRSSPFGCAHTWLAVDSAGEVVGTAAMFPRTIFVDGQQRQGGVLGDFCVSESHRSLGPALQLQKQCLTAMRAGEFTFCYDFPSQAMLSVYHRLGLTETHRMVRLSRPLNLAQRFRQGRLGSALLASTVGRCGNLFLRHNEQPPSSAFHFGEHSQTFDQEFTTLACRLAQGYGVHTFRSAAYLNWRYRNHPARQYRVITARTPDSRLAGYVIFFLDQKAATIADLFCRPETALIQGLVQSAAAHVRSAGAPSLSFPVLQDSAWIPLLREIGFRQRESNPLVTYMRPDHSRPATHELLLLAGDRES